MRLPLLVLAVQLAACTRGGDRASQPQVLEPRPAAAGVTCDELADHVMQLLASSSEDWRGRTKPTKQRVSTECEQQALPQAQRRCAMDASDGPAVKACFKGPDVSCAQAADHIIEVAVQSSGEARPSDADLAAFKTNLTQDCFEEKWSLAKIQCVMGAANQESLDQCLAGTR